MPCLVFFSHDHHQTFSIIFCVITIDETFEFLDGNFLRASVSFLYEFPSQDALVRCVYDYWSKDYIALLRPIAHAQLIGPFLYSLSAFPSIT
jgi:hypothetical protein